MAEPRALPPGAALSGCYLLIVVGDPNSIEHRDVILQKITKGFLSWDIEATGCCISAELQYLVDQAPIPEEAKNGEKLIQFVSENLVTEVLINPQTNTLQQCIKNLLSSYTKHKHIIHSGYAFAGNGSWILQDSTFSFADFIDSFQDAEVQRIFKAYENCISIHVHCAPEGDWNTPRLNKESWSKLAKVVINPNDKCSNLHGINNFVNFLGRHIVARPLEEILEPSDVVGNIRFSRPTLYIFPGGQGDSALFGVNGFNMLIDGGFNRKACFWDFARHLDRVDALLVTRVSNSNMNGVSSFLKRKVMGQVYPKIGHVFCNILDRKHSPDGDKDTDSLLISLAEEGHLMMENLRHIGLKPQNCYSGTNAEPLNLYHKVGHGKLDMYVLNPARDSKEVKEFLQQWHSQSSALGSSRLGMKVGDKEMLFPVPNLMSICAILVWQPADPTDSITRILFPGSSPQSKIFKGLEKLQHLEILKSPICSEKSLQSNTKIRSKMQMGDIKPIRLNTARITSVKADEKGMEPVAKPIVPKIEKKHDQKVIPTKVEEKKQHIEPKNIIKEEKKIEAVKSVPKAEAKKPEVRKQLPSTERKQEPKKVQMIGGKVIETITPTPKILNGSGKPHSSTAKTSSVEPTHKFTSKAKGLKEATNKKAVEEKNIAMKKEATKKEAIKKDSIKKKPITKTATEDVVKPSKFSIKAPSAGTTASILQTDLENRKTEDTHMPESSKIENKNEIKQEHHEQQQPHSSFEVPSPSEDMGEVDTHLAMDSAEEEKASVEEKQSLDEEVQAEKDIVRKDEDLNMPEDDHNIELLETTTSVLPESDLTSLPTEKTTKTTENPITNEIPVTDNNQWQVEQEIKNETTAIETLQHDFSNDVTKKNEKQNDDDETIKPLQTTETITELESTTTPTIAEKIEKDHSISKFDVEKETETTSEDTKSIHKDDDVDVLDLSPKNIDLSSNKEAAINEKQQEIKDISATMPQPPPPTSQQPQEVQETVPTNIIDKIDTTEPLVKHVDSSKVEETKIPTDVEVETYDSQLNEALISSKETEVVRDIDKLPTYEQSMVKHAEMLEENRLKSNLDKQEKEDKTVIHETAPTKEVKHVKIDDAKEQESQEVTKIAVADDIVADGKVREDAEVTSSSKLIVEKPLEEHHLTMIKNEPGEDELIDKKREIKEDRVIDKFSEKKHEDSKDAIEPSVQTATDEKVEMHTEELFKPHQVTPLEKEITTEEKNILTISMQPSVTEIVSKSGDTEEHKAAPVIATTKPHAETSKIDTTKPEEASSTTTTTTIKGHDEKMPPSSPVDKLLDHDQHGQKLGVVDKDFKTGIILSPIPEDAPKLGKAGDIIRDPHQPVSDQPQPQQQQQPIHSQEFLRTPDEVADLPIHEEVPSEYEGYYHIRGPLHGIPETLAEHEDLLADVKGILRSTTASSDPLRPISEKDNFVTAEHEEIKIEDDILLSTLKADHAEVVTLSNDTSPSTPLSPKSPKDKDLNKHFEAKEVAGIKDTLIHPEQEVDVYNTNTIEGGVSAFVIPSSLATEEHKLKDHQKDKETKDDENMLQQLEDTTKLEKHQKLLDEELNLQDGHELKKDQEKITESKDNKDVDLIAEKDAKIWELHDTKEAHVLHPIDTHSKDKQEEFVHEKPEKNSEFVERQEDVICDTKENFLESPDKHKDIISERQEDTLYEKLTKIQESVDKLEATSHHVDEKVLDTKDEHKKIIHEAKETALESKDVCKDSESQKQDAIPKKTDGTSEIQDIVPKPTHGTSEKQDTVLTETHETSQIKDIVSKSINEASEIQEIVPKSTVGASKTQDTVSKSTDEISKTHEIVPKTTVGTSEIQDVVPKTTVGTSDTHEIVPKSTVLTSETHDIVSKATVGTFETHETVPKSTVESSETHDVVSKSTVESSETHDVVSKSTVGASETHDVVSKSTVGASETHDVVSKSTVGASETHDVVSKSTVGASETNDVVSKSTIGTSETQDIVPKSGALVPETHEIVSKSTIGSSEIQEDIVRKPTDESSQMRDIVPKSVIEPSEKQAKELEDKDISHITKAETLEQITNKQQDIPHKVTETVLETTNKQEHQMSDFKDDHMKLEETLQIGTTAKDASILEESGKPHKTETHVDLSSSTAFSSDATFGSKEEPTMSKIMQTSATKQEDHYEESDNVHMTEISVPHLEKITIKESMKIEKEPEIELVPEAKETSVVTAKTAPPPPPHPVEDIQTQKHQDDHHHYDVSISKDEHLPQSHTEKPPLDSKDKKITSDSSSEKHLDTTHDSHKHEELTSTNIIEEPHILAEVSTLDKQAIYNTEEMFKSENETTKDLETSLLIDKFLMSKPIDPMTQSFYDETTATVEDPLDTITDIMSSQTYSNLEKRMTDTSDEDDDDKMVTHSVLLPHEPLEMKKSVHELHDAKAVDDFASTQMTAKHDDIHRSSLYSSPPDIIDIEKKASSSTRPLEIGAGTATSSATFTTQSYEPITKDEKPLTEETHLSSVTDKTAVSTTKPQSSDKDYDGYYEVHDPEIFGFVQPPEDVTKTQTEIKPDVLTPRSGLDILPEAERSQSSQSNTSIDEEKITLDYRTLIQEPLILSKETLNETTVLSEKELTHKDEKDKEESTKIEPTSYRNPFTEDWHHDPHGDTSQMTASYYDPSTVIVEEGAHADVPMYGRDRSETFIGEEFDARSSVAVTDNHDYSGHGAHETEKMSSSTHYVEDDLNEYPPAYYQHHVEHYDDDSIQYPYPQSTVSEDVLYERDPQEHGKVMPDVMQSPIHSGSYVSADDDTEDDYRGRHYEDKHSDADSESPYHRPVDHSTLRTHVQLQERMAFQPPVGAESTSDDSDLDTPHQHYSRPERYYDIGEQQQQQQQQQKYQQHQAVSGHPDDYDRFGGGQGGNWDFDSSYEIPTLAEQHEHSSLTHTTKEFGPESHASHMDRGFYQAEEDEEEEEEGEKWSPSHDYPRQQHFATPQHGRPIPGGNNHESPYGRRRSSSDSDQDSSSGLSPKGFEMDSPEVRHVPFQLNKNRHEGSLHREEPDSSLYPRGSVASLSSPSSHDDKLTPDDKKGKSVSKNPFDDWGEPMGLPSPIPPPDDNDKSKSKQGERQSRLGGHISGGQSTEPKKQQLKNNSANSKINGKAEDKDMRKDTENKKEGTKSSDKSGKKGPAPPTASPKRMPPSSSIKSSPIKTKRPESPLLTSDSRRAASSNRYGTQQTTQPIYVDLTYVPHHGNPFYSDVEFFRTVRARYYVFSGTNPSKEVFKALLEAKQTWEDPDLEVTVIPTYDTDTMGYWFALHEDELAKYKIDLAPSAIRCTINLQDHETSCSAYRLEF